MVRTELPCAAVSPPPGRRQAKGRRAAGEGEHDSADRAENRANKEREEHARPSEERTHHTEEPYVAHPDAFAAAEQEVDFAGDKEETRADRDADERASPSDLGYRE